MNLNSESIPQKVDERIEKYKISLNEEVWRDKINDGILLEAVLSDDDQVAAIMLKEGANPNCKLSSSKTPLMIAASRGNLKITKALLKLKDTDPNIFDENEWTASVYAGSSEHEKVFRALHNDPRTNYSLKNSQGVTVKDLVKRNSPQNIAGIFFEDREANLRYTFFAGYGSLGIFGIFLFLYLKKSSTAKEEPSKFVVIETFKGQSEISDFEASEPELFSRSGVVVIRNSKNLFDLLNQLKEHQNQFKKAFITAHGWAGSKIPEIDVFEEGGNVSIVDLIKSLNQDNGETLKEIHFASCGLGSHISEIIYRDPISHLISSSPYYESLNRVLPPDQTIYLHGNKSVHKFIGSLPRLESALNDKLSPLVNAVISSPEAITAIRKDCSDASAEDCHLSFFSHQTFSEQNLDGKISVAEIREYFKDSISKAVEFESRGLSRGEVIEEISKLTERDFQKYLSLNFILDISKFSNPEEISRWADAIEGGEVDIDVVDISGRSPLIYAFSDEYRNEFLFKFLLDRGANPNILAPYREPLLIEAYRFNKPEFLDLLLKCPKTDLNATDNNGDTLLKSAFDRADVSFVKKLLKDPRLNPNLPNNKGETIWRLSVNNFLESAPVNKAEHFEILELLILHPKIDSDILKDSKDCGEFAVAAMRNGNSDLARKLISRPEFDVKKNIKDGGTILLEAIQAEDIEVVKLILAIPEADPNLAGRYNSGVLFGEATPLTKAVRLGNIEIVKLLVADKRTDLDAMENGLTPLMLAAEGDNLFGGNHHNNSLPIAKLLLEHGADPDKQEDQGMNAMDIAKYQGLEEMYDLIKSFSDDKKLASLRRSQDSVKSNYRKRSGKELGELPLPTITPDYRRSAHQLRGATNVEVNTPMQGKEYSQIATAWLILCVLLVAYFRTKPSNSITNRGSKAPVSVAEENQPRGGKKDK